MDLNRTKLIAESLEHFNLNMGTKIFALVYLKKKSINSSHVPAFDNMKSVVQQFISQKRRKLTIRESTFKLNRLSTES